MTNDIIQNHILIIATDIKWKLKLIIETDIERIQTDIERILERNWNLELMATLFEIENGLHWFLTNIFFIYFFYLTIFILLDSLLKIMTHK